MLSSDARASQVSKTLRKLGHDAKGPLINVKMGLEILGDLDAETRAAVTSEMIGTLEEMQSLLEESFLFAQLPYLDREPLSLVSIIREFEQAALQPVEVQTEDCARVEIDAQRLGKTLHWWQRVQQPDSKCTIQVGGDPNASQLRLSWNPKDGSDSKDRLMLFLDAFCSHLGGSVEWEPSSALLRFPAAAA